MARDSVQEFQQIQPIHAKIPMTAISVRWRPPLVGWVKVNFDNPLFSQDDTAGLNIIICNDHGLIMAALSQQIPLPTSVEMV